MEKRSIQGLATIMILCFHLFPFPTKGLWIGVDLFLLCSGYWISNHDIDFSFYKNRWKQIYIPFVFFSILSFFVKQWSISKLLSILCFMDFFLKQETSFLWFCPFILICYGLAWILKKIKKYQIIIYTSIYLFLSFFISSSLLFHLYMFCLGTCFEKKNVSLLAGFSLLFFICGASTIWVFVPILYGLVSIFPRVKALEWVSMYSLELYGFQMTLGYGIENYLLNSCSKSFSFLFTCLILMGVSILFQKGLKKYEKADSYYNVYCIMCLFF
ncbi:acyltransferase family protein [Floccifex sp.]|uniref:acyltransferase family protein n=1 Tax=Floccifex sp. TaxID=2815810 RepID=UPI003F0AA039